MLAASPQSEIFGQFMRRAGREHSVKAIVLFGSQARASGVVNGADHQSDFDLQVVTSRPEVFLQRGWWGDFSGHELLVRAVRPASGGVKKVTVIFKPTLELDVILVPAYRMELARLVVSSRLYRYLPSLRKALDELAYVMRPGYEVLKGGARWKNFYMRVVADMDGTRLHDTEIVSLAEIFICDFIWVKRMIARGELVAAQRTLHRSLAEINFKFLHELRLRRKQVTFREARRIEHIASPEELANASIDSDLTSPALLAATVKLGVNCRTLVDALLGGSWIWPVRGE